MAIATGTAAVIGAGLTAAGAFGGAKVAANSANKSTKAQLAANDQAMAYTREQDAKAEREKAEAKEKYFQANRDLYRMYGDAMIKKYGLPPGMTLADLQGSGPVAGTGKGTVDPGVAQRATAAVMAPGYTARRATIADLSTSPVGEPVPMEPAGGEGAMAPYLASARTAMRAPAPMLSPAVVEPPDIPRRRRTLADLTAGGY